MSGCRPLLTHSFPLIRLFQQLQRPQTPDFREICQIFSHLPYRYQILGRQLSQRFVSSLFALGHAGRLTPSVFLTLFEILSARSTTTNICICCLEERPAEVSSPPMRPSMERSSSIWGPRMPYPRVIRQNPTSAPVWRSRAVRTDAVRHFHFNHRLSRGVALPVVSGCHWHRLRV